MLLHYSQLVIIIIINLLAQKHDKVTCATKQNEQHSKDTDATNSCPRKVQIKLFCKLLIHFKNKEKSIGTTERLKAFSIEKYTSIH